MTVPVIHSAVDLDSDKATYVEDVFVNLHLQRYTTETFSERLSYLDLKEKESRVQSSEAISIDELFNKRERDVHKKTTPSTKELIQDRSGVDDSSFVDVHNKNKAPTKVLIQGKPGVGKTTLVNYMANQWAKGSLWPYIKYIFVVKLKEFQPNEMWSLDNLLLNGLTLPEPRMKAAFIEEILRNPEKIVIIIDSIDEFCGYEYSPQRIPDINKKVASSTLVSAIIGDMVLPGAKVVVTSRPTQRLPVKAFDHVVQLQGFTNERIREYVYKTAYRKEEAEFIMMNLDGNPNMARFCHVPLQCNFMCTCLADRFAFAESGEAPTLNTTTDLYVQATVQMASKLHPHLKYSKEATDLDNLFDKIAPPLKKHADLAIHGIMSSPPQFIFEKRDLDRFGFSETDRNCGFLVESQTEDRRMKGARRPCWTFSHATMHELFAALGMLRSDDTVRVRFMESTLVEQLNTMVVFLAGLLGDSSHQYYVERLVPGGAKLDSRLLTTQLTRKLNDDAVTLAAVFETQNSGMVDIVGTEIECSNMTPMDVRSLAWVLEKEEYCITSLW